MSWDQVLRNSPILHVPENAPPLLLVYGEDETAEFRRQSEEFLVAWRSRGLDADLLTLPGDNHYDVLEGFLDPESLLYSAVLQCIVPG